MYRSRDKSASTKGLDLGVPLTFLLMTLNTQLKISYSAADSENSATAVSAAETPFEWTDTGVFSQCSVTCGSGQEMTSVVCRDTRTGSRMKDVYCYKTNPVKTAPRVRECQLSSCGPIWIVDGDWSRCSSSCVDDATGVSTRFVYCAEELSDGSLQRTLDKLCNPEDKPESRRTCSGVKDCPKWIAGQWSPMTKPLDLLWVCVLAPNFVSSISADVVPKSVQKELRSCLQTQCRQNNSSSCLERPCLASTWTRQRTCNQGTRWSPKVRWKASRIRWQAGKCMTWDVTVTDTLAESYLATTSLVVGSAAEGAANRKELKYQLLSSTHTHLFHSPLRRLALSTQKCSVTCGSGHQERVALCRPTGPAGVGCNDAVRPPTRKTCHQRACDRNGDYDEEDYNSGTHHSEQLQQNKLIAIDDRDEPTTGNRNIDERGTETAEIHDVSDTGPAMTSPPLRLDSSASIEDVTSSATLGTRITAHHVTTLENVTSSTFGEDEDIRKKVKSFRSSVQVLVFFDKDDASTDGRVISESEPPKHRPTSNIKLLGRGNSSGNGQARRRGKLEHSSGDEFEVELDENGNVMTPMRKSNKKKFIEQGTSPVTSHSTVTVEPRGNRSKTTPRTTEEKKLNDSTDGPLFASRMRYEWQVFGESTPCSVTCGHPGVRLRRVQCVARHTARYNDNPRPEFVASDHFCRNLVKPLTIEPCGSAMPCWPAAWTTTDWSKAPLKSIRQSDTSLELCVQCSATCGVIGTRTRQVRCAWQPLLGNDSAPADVTHCAQFDRPIAVKKCMLPPCTSIGCRDQSHYCSLVSRISLCHLTQYQQKCCHSCQRTVRQWKNRPSYR